MNTIINQRYRLLTVLGKGAQGVVYLAMDQLRDDQQVALKVLTAVHFNAVLRFEFAQAAKLDHPHLARVYDFGIIAQHEAGDASLPRGAAFFTQEFVAGLPAQRWAAPLRGDERIFDIVKVGVQVARGLALMHRCGLIHRDVKPANIVVNKTGTSAKLIDFGLAVSMDALDGMKAGTLAFMAPEAVHGFPDVRSDIFSLGATLITLLGGAPQRQPSAMLPRLPDDTPLALATALTRMVHPRASDRFQNASDVVLALAGAVGASVLGESRGDVVVDAATDSSDAAARWSRSRSPELVGRDALLETLASWMGEERGIRTGILIGPAGVGKTRLFRTAVVARQLECGAEGGATPPQFLAGTLRQLVRTLMRSVGHDNTLLVRWLKGADLLDIHGGSAAESLIEEMVSLIRAAITLPTVVLVEGAQSVLEVGLLERLAKETGPTDRGIWVAVEARELGRAAADSRHLLVEVPPLTEQAEQELITLVLGRKPNASYAGSIHRMTGGIPALTEAVLAALLAKRPDGKIEAASLDEVALGGKPTQMLQEVLETLPGTVRRVAEALAVAATPLTEVEVSVLAELSDPAQLTSALADLEGRGWISLDSDEVVMRRLVGEVLLESLSSSRRTGISRRMVSVLDARTAPLWQRVHHAVNAGMVSEAKGHVDAAVKALQGSGDLPGAAILLESYLSHISNDDPDTDRYETELARLYRQTGEYRAAIRHAEAVEKRGGSSADEAALEKAASLRLVGAADEATTMLERLSHAEDGRVAVNARVQLARLALDSGRRLEASEHLSGIAIDAFREAGPDTLNTVGLIALFAGDDQKARTLFQRGLADAERAGDIRSQARFHGLLGMVCHGRSGWRDASECYENAFRLAEKAGDRHGAATYQTNLAAALTEEGRLEEALNAYRDGLERLRIFGRPEEIAQASANYAELLHRLGDLDAADRASIAAVNHGRAAGHRPLALALCVRGDLLLSRGALDDAEEMLYKAELLAETDALSTERNVARLHLTALAIARNRLIEAEEKLESISVADLSGAPTLALTHRRLTLVLALEGVGDVERALRSLIEMLPASTRDARAEHLSAFFWVARGANMLGSVDRARWAASAALGILERIRRETPSLYHQADTPMLKEMNRILRADSTVEAPEETRADWRRLARINTRLNSEIRVGRLLEIVMDAALDITGAERGFLLIANPKGELKVGCARNMDKASLLPDDESFSRTVAMRAFTSAEPVLTTDAREDARFNAMRSVVNLNLRYIVAVPLSVSQKPTGTI
jgi:serine/threonine-protein kinase PknK